MSRYAVCWVLLHNKIIRFPKSGYLKVAAFLLVANSDLFKTFLITSIFQQKLSIHPCATLLEFYFLFLCLFVSQHAA